MPIEAIKVTRPTYTGVIGPLIQKYYEKVNIHNLPIVTYETLFTYISNIVQFGGDMAELWVSYKDDTPVGFAVWRVMGAPYQGTVYCEHLFRTVKDHAVTLELGKEFIEFGRRHHAPYYMFDAINEVIARVLKRLASEINLNLLETGTQNFIGRLNNG